MAIEVVNSIVNLDGGHRGGISCRLFMSFAGNWLVLATWRSTSIPAVHSAVCIVTIYRIRRMTWERWTKGARPRPNVLADLARSKATGGRSARDRGLPLVRPLSIGRGGPANAKSASHPRAIPPSRSNGHHMRHEKRRRFRHFGAQSLEIHHDVSLSVRKSCTRSGSPAPRRSLSGSRPSAKPMRRESTLG